jgi:hypothetical protein
MAGWLQVKCRRRETEASIPLGHPPAAQHLELEAGSIHEMPILPESLVRAAGPHNQAT